MAKNGLDFILSTPQFALAITLAYAIVTGNQLNLRYAQIEEREEEALKKPASQRKRAETERTPTVAEGFVFTSTTTAQSSVEAWKGKASAANQKMKGEGKHKEKQSNLEEIIAIESNEESSSELVIDDQAEGMSDQRAVKRPVLQ